MYWIWLIIKVFHNNLASLNFPSDPEASLADIGCWTLDPPHPGSWINISRLRCGEQGNTILEQRKMGSASIDVDLIKRVGWVEIIFIPVNQGKATWETATSMRSVFASPQNSDSFVHLYSNLKFTLHSDNKGHVHKNKFGFPPARLWFHLQSAPSISHSGLRNVRLYYNWTVFVCKWYFFFRIT